MPTDRPLTDIAIAKALGVSSMTVGRWRRRRCPNSSIQAVREWAEKHAFGYRRRLERKKLAELQNKLLSSWSGIF
jgi:hypothetical protein